MPLDVLCRSISGNLSLLVFGVPDLNHCCHLYHCLAINVMCCRFVIAGGVACNRSVRSSFAELAEDLQLELTIPDPHFCTDNGAMVAWAGLERSASPKHLNRPCKDLLACSLRSMYLHLCCAQSSLIFFDLHTVSSARVGSSVSLPP